MREDACSCPGPLLMPVICICVCVCTLSRVQFLAAPWTVACQDPLSMGFSRQEYWSGLPFPSPGVLPDPGIEPRSPALQADSLPTELWGKPHCGLIYPKSHKQGQRCSWDPDLFMLMGDCATLKGGMCRVFYANKQKEKNVLTEINQMRGV